MCSGGYLTYRYITKNVLSEKHVNRPVDLRRQLGRGWKGPVEIGRLFQLDDGLRMNEGEDLYV